MSKISIKEFCKKYESMSNETLKKQYLEKIIITSYVPIITKDAYAQLIVDKTMFEQEAYNDNEKTKYRKTDKIKVNSVVQYVQFCRAVIELYTNLEIEDGSFIKEYDALKSSGLLDILMLGSDQRDPLISMSELSEFKTILNMKVSDTLKNYSDPQTFIERQVDKFKILGEATLTPLMNAISKKFDDIPKEDLNRVVEFAKKSNFKEV